MHSNQLALLALLAYSIISLWVIVSFLNKIKLKWYYKTILAILCLFVFIFGLGILADLLIKDT